jgi:hypothetical protein
MSSTTDPAGAARSEAVTEDYGASRGYGWVIFAGTMLLIVGTLNLIYGIAAISDSHFYVKDASYVISNLSTWGWTLAIVGGIQVVSAFGIWAQSPGARWVGILTAGVNAIIQMLVIAGYPFLALSLFSIDILIIYGLLAHGRRS